MVKVDGLLVNEGALQRIYQHKAFEAGNTEKANERAIAFAMIGAGEPLVWDRSPTVYSFGRVHRRGWTTIEDAARAWCIYHKVDFISEPDE